MIAIRIASFFFLAFTFGSISAAPTTHKEPALAKRASTSDVTNILTTLKQTTTSVATTIHDLVSKDDASELTLFPVLNELKTALETASSSLEVVDAVVATTADPAVAEIANLAQGIITEIFQVLSTVQDVTEVAGLIAGIDGALNRVLVGLGAVVAGILELVHSVLNTVLAVLQGAVLQTLILPLALSTLGF